MYEEFLEKSLNNKRQAVDDTFIAKYADLSYPELNTLWQEVGLGSYCNGLFKLINPSDYQDVINSCYEKEDDKSFLPFMCTAFGDVFAYVKNPRLNNYVVYLNVRYGTYLILPANLRAIFNKVMVNQSFLKGWFDLENYPVIQEKLGTGACYCYISFTISFIFLLQISTQCLYELISNAYLYLANLFKIKSPFLIIKLVIVKMK
jgi:hypothetical protein